jgi:hypothetical protein
MPGLFEIARLGEVDPHFHILMRGLRRRQRLARRLL